MHFNVWMLPLRGYSNTHITHSSNWVNHFLIVGKVDKMQYTSSTCIMYHKNTFSFNFSTIPNEKLRTLLCKE